MTFLTFDTPFQFHYSYKSCESRPVWGACKFQALWLFAEGLFLLIFLNYFPGKEGFLKDLP